MNHEKNMLFCQFLRHLMLPGSMPVESTSLVFGPWTNRTLFNRQDGIPTYANRISDSWCLTGVGLTISRYFQKSGLHGIFHGFWGGTICTWGRVPFTFPPNTSIKTCEKNRTLEAFFWGLLEQLDSKNQGFLDILRFPSNWYTLVDSYYYVY